MQPKIIGGDLDSAAKFLLSGTNVEYYMNRKYTPSQKGNNPVERNTSQKNFTKTL